MKREKIEALVKEYLVELKDEGVDPKRFGFEISTYLKSLASMDRNPIAAELAKDFEAIKKITEDL
jgi:hypothetical protein